MSDSANVAQSLDNIDTHIRTTRKAGLQLEGSLIGPQSIGEFLPIVQSSGDAVPDTRVGKSIGTAGGIGSSCVAFHHLEGGEVGQHGGM